MMSRALLCALLLALARGGAAVCPAGQYIDPGDGVTCLPCDGQSYCDGTTITSCPFEYYAPTDASVAGDCSCRHNIDPTYDWWNLDLSSYTVSSSKNGYNDPRMNHYWLYDASVSTPVVEIEFNRASPIVGIVTGFTDPAYAPDPYTQAGYTEIYTTANGWTQAQLDGAVLDGQGHYIYTFTTDGNTLFNASSTPYLAVAERIRFTVTSPAAGDGALTFAPLVESSCTSYCPLDSCCDGTVRANSQCLSSACQYCACDTCECIPGYFGNGLTCNLCNANDYCLGGATATPCGSNKESPPGSDDATDCTCILGTYDLAGVCTTCPSNYYCYNSMLIQCPLGSRTATTGSSNITDCYCNPGTQFTGPDATSCECLATYYLSGTYCLPCPAGSYCPQGLDPPTACPSNSDSPASSDEFVDCTCNAGYTDVGGVTCVCNDGTYATDGSGCATCQPGYYCSGGVAYQCPANSATVSTGAVNVSQCLCVSGYAGTGGANCAVCLDGSFCPGGTQAYQCPTDWHTVPAASSLDNCSCPLWTTGDEVLFHISEKNYSWYGEDNSPTAEPWWYSPVGWAFTGSSSDAVIQISLDQPLWISGYTVVEYLGFRPSQNLYFYYTIGDPNVWYSLGVVTGPTNPATAGPGVVLHNFTLGTMYWVDGVRFRENAFSPVSTAWSIGIRGPAWTNCSQCPAGHCCDGGAVAYAHAECTTPGHYALIACASADCLCRPGYYGDKTNCQLCPVGSYCPGDTVVTACPALQTSPAGSDALADCDCEPGAYHTDASTCAVCSPGSYCLGGAAPPAACPDPHHTSPPGSRALADCVCESPYYGANGTNCSLCPANSFCPGADKIWACPANYGSLPGSDTVGDCRCPLLLTNGTCLACPADTCCNGGSIAHTDAVCINGTAVPEMPCYECGCSPGFYGAAGVNCTSCPENSYCPGGSNVTVCPDGRPSPQGSHVLANCSCLPGTFRGDTGCLACGAGSYCLGGVTQPSACPAANTTSAPGSAAPSECYCVPSYVGANGTNCTLCSANSFCPGADKIWACPAYSGSLPGASAPGDCLCQVPLANGTCAPCPVGTCCDGVPVAHTGSTCVSAPTIPEMPCQLCSCNAGFIGDADGHNCTTCPENNYCTGGGSAQACPANYGSPAGSDASADCECPRLYVDSGHSIRYSSSALYSVQRHNNPAGPHNPWLSGSGFKYQMRGVGASITITFPSLTWVSGVRIGSCPDHTGSWYVTANLVDGTLEGGTVKALRRNTGELLFLAPNTANSFQNTYFASPVQLTKIVFTETKPDNAGLYACWRADVIVPNGVGCTTCPEGSCCIGDYDAFSNADCADSPLWAQMPCADCQCAPGFYGSYTNCLACPAGSYCPLGATAVACPALQTSPAGSGVLQDCTCEPGAFRSNASTWECSACEPGSFCPGGEAPPEACPDPNMSSPPGSVALAACACEPGFYDDPPGANCSVCPENFYCPGGAAQTPCPANSGALAGAGAESDCLCPLPLANGTCVPCPPGVCCDGAPVAHAGSACVVAGALPTLPCALCECLAGFVGDASGHNCSACPANSYCAGGTAEQACPANYGAPEGSDAAGDCECPLLVSQTGNQVHSTPTGWYSILRATNAGPTQPWLSGLGLRYELRGENTAIRIDFSAPLWVSGVRLASCSADWYVTTNKISVRLAGSGATESLRTAGGSLSFPAPNTYNSYTDSILATPVYIDRIEFTETKALNLGNYGCWKAGVFVPASVGCAACPSGECCEGSFVSLADTVCGGGANAPASPCDACWCADGFHGTNGTACAPCPAGSWCPAAALDTVNACPALETSPPGSHLPANCTCVLGTYRSSGGACAACAPGAYCPGGEQPAEPCPAPNMTSAPGASALADCHCIAGFAGANGTNCSLCPANSFCPGADSVSACPANYGSPAGSDAAGDCLCAADLGGGACGLCGEGQCCDGAANDNSECLNGSTGLLPCPQCRCAAGFYGAGGHGCALCPAGSWCPVGLSGEINACPPLETSPPGSVAEADCGCAAGSYALNNSDCATCPADHYCRGGQHPPSPCPDPNMTSAAGSSAATDCSCVSTYFGADGTNCSLCTPGFFCPGSGQISPCPDNHGSPPGSGAAGDCECPVKLPYRAQALATDRYVTVYYDHIILGATYTMVGIGFAPVGGVLDYYVPQVSIQCRSATWTSKTHSGGNRNFVLDQTLGWTYFQFDTATPCYQMEFQLKTYSGTTETGQFWDAGLKYSQSWWEVQAVMLFDSAGPSEYVCLGCPGGECCDGSAVTHASSSCVDPGYTPGMPCGQCRCDEVSGSPP